MGVVEIRVGVHGSGAVVKFEVGMRARAFGIAGIAYIANHRSRSHEHAFFETRGECDVRSSGPIVGVEGVVVEMHVPALPPVLMFDSHVVAGTIALTDSGDEAISDCDDGAVLCTKDVGALVAAPTGSGIAPIIAESRGHVLLGEVDELEVVVRQCRSRCGNDRRCDESEQKNRYQDSGHCEKVQVLGDMQICEDVRLLSIGSYAEFLERGPPFRRSAGPGNLSLLTTGETVKTLDSQASAAAGASDPGWLAARRSTALEYYEKLDMPSPAEEVWRYVELDFNIDDYQLASSPGEAHELDAGIAAALPDTSGSLLLVDGHVVASERGTSGVAFGSLGTVLSEQPGLLEPYVGAAIPADLDKFVAAHAAFGGEGAALVVPKGVVVEKPFFIDVQAATSGSIAFPHLSLAVGESAQASVVVRYRSDDDVDALVVPQLELFVADNAQLKVTVVQHWGRRTRSIAYAHAVVGRDSAVHLGEAGVGGAISRLHLNVDLEGNGSSANIVGAYFGDESQTLDYRYFMHHAGVNTDSDMFLKGAVQDESLSVFTGMIRIDEGAQKTNAYQTNRNLILSDGASAQSVPNLEILANDVRCGHGSTMGPLDEEQRYYLMSRGLDEDRSNRLLVHGFFNEALARFPEPAIADVVGSWIDAKYRAAQEAGRVR